MRFTIESQALAQALTRLEPVLRKARYPFSKSLVLVQAAADGLRICAWHGELHATLALTAGYQVGEVGEAVVSQQDLLGAATWLAGELSVHLEETALVCAAGGELHRYLPLPLSQRAELHPPTLFQVPAEAGSLVERQETVTHTCPSCSHVSRSSVARAYRVRVEHWCASLPRAPFAEIVLAIRRLKDKSDPEQVYRCTQLALEQGQFWLLAADRHALGLGVGARIEQGSTLERPLLIPTRLLRQAVLALPAGEEPVEIEALFRSLEPVPGPAGSVGPPQEVDDLLRLSSGGTRILLPLVREAPPDYARVLAAAYTTRAVCETGAFARAVEALTSPASAYGKLLHCTLKRQVLSLEVPLADAPFPARYDLALAAERSGPEVTVMLGPWYVAAFLAGIKTGQVEIGCRGEKSPVAFTPVGDDESAPRFIVMPCAPKTEGKD